LRDRTANLVGDSSALGDRRKEDQPQLAFLERPFGIDEAVEPGDERPHVAPPVRQFGDSRLALLSLGRQHFPDFEEAGMAKKTIRVSDMSGDEIPEGKGATVRITFADARRGVRELDVTDAEAEKLGGRAVARRGRKPKDAA
jgi:hypothetical protein